MRGRTYNRLLACGFAGMLLGVSVLLAVTPKSSFSELENRYLQAFPRLDWESVSSKKFADETEAYLSDHFPWRNGWIGLKSRLETLRGQRENNGVYLGSGGWLFEAYRKPQSDVMQAYADKLKTFAGHHPDLDISFMLSPNSVGMDPDRLPTGAPHDSQREVNKEFGRLLQGRGIHFLNGFSFLDAAAGSKQLFYRTDHHWTTYGAFLAYRAYARSMNWTPLTEQDFTVRPVSSSFLGSYQTRGQFAGLKPDEIDLYVPKVSYPLTMSILDTGQTKNSLYDGSYLAKKDQYSYFLGGVHALSVIRTELPPARADLDKLLVVKDSYAHSAIPFLALHAREIHVIDPRYYNGSIGDYAAANGIEQILFLFNTGSLFETSGLLNHLN